MKPNQYSKLDSAKYFAPWTTSIHLVLTCIHYEKAFKSIETEAIPSATRHHRMDSSYVRTLAD